MSQKSKNPWWGRRTGEFNDRHSLARHDWIRAQELLQSGKCCEARVKRVNRGGVVVQFGHLQGFVPNSHLAAGKLQPF